MIPYDDLVVALTTWRARQGLPVGQLSAQLTPPPVQSTSAQYAAVSAPVATKPGSGGTRPAPPPPRGNTGARAAVPPPLESPTEDSLDVDDAALLDEENESDFHVRFPAGDASRDTMASMEHESESTSIGSAPLRDSYGGETMLDSELEGDDALAPMTPKPPKPPTW
jgi:hypothetical protein